MIRKGRSIWYQAVLFCISVPEFVSSLVLYPRGFQLAFLVVLGQGRAQGYWFLVHGAQRYSPPYHAQDNLPQLRMISSKESTVHPLRNCSFLLAIQFPSPKWGIVNNRAVFCVFVFVSGCTGSSLLGMSFL